VRIRVLPQAETVEQSCLEFCSSAAKLVEQIVAQGQILAYGGLIVGDADDVLPAIHWCNEMGDTCEWRVFTAARGDLVFSYYATTPWLPTREESSGSRFIALLQAYSCFDLRGQQLISPDSNAEFDSFSFGEDFSFDGPFVVGEPAHYACFVRQSCTGKAAYK